jgi:hypothetical protein
VLKVLSPQMPRGQGELALHSGHNEKNPSRPALRALYRDLACDYAAEFLVIGATFDPYDE